MNRDSRERPTSGASVEPGRQFDGTHPVTQSDLGREREREVGHSAKRGMDSRASDHVFGRRVEFVPPRSLAHAKVCQGIRNCRSQGSWAILFPHGIDDGEETAFPRSEHHALSLDVQ